MTYDPNDPKDKEIVQGLIDAALEEQKEAHEAEITRLKEKNQELLGKIRKARTGENPDAGEIERLERDLEETTNKLRQTESDLRETKRKLHTATDERDTARRDAETESNFSRSMLIESGLTAALTEAKVAPQFFEGAKALLSKGVTVKEVDGVRKAFVNDKALSEYVKEWAAGDAGKAYIQAPANGGGGANGGASNAGATGKKLADLSEAERLQLARTNPVEWQRILAESQPQAA